VGRAGGTLFAAQSAIHSAGNPLRIETPTRASCKSLLTAFPAEEMEAYPVSTLVNSLRNDPPECVVPAG
jgi:hypothetical protein